MYDIHQVQCLCSHAWATHPDLHVSNACKATHPDLHVGHACKGHSSWPACRPCLQGTLILTWMSAMPSKLLILTWMSAVHTLPYLYIEQPRSQIVNALVSILHTPDHQIESITWEKALVSSIVDFLSGHIPDTEHHVGHTLGEEGRGRGRIVKQCHNSSTTVA